MSAHVVMHVQQRDDALLKIQKLLAVARQSNEVVRQRLDSDHAPREAMRCLLAANLIKALELHFVIHSRDEAQLADSHADLHAGAIEGMKQKGAQ